MKTLLAKYFPLDEDEEILRMSDRLPVDAVVTRLHDQSADLAVTDHFGGRHVRLNIPVGSRTGTDFCTLI